LTTSSPLLHSLYTNVSTSASSPPDGPSIFVLQRAVHIAMPLIWGLIKRARQTTLRLPARAEPY
jgi:hypothetical protein